MAKSKLKSLAEIAGRVFLACDLLLSVPVFSGCFSYMEGHTPATEVNRVFDSRLKNSAPVLIPRTIKDDYLQKGHEGLKISRAFYVRQVSLPDEMKDDYLDFVLFAPRETGEQKWAEDENPSLFPYKTFIPKRNHSASGMDMENYKISEKNIVLHEGYAEMDHAAIMNEIDDLKTTILGTDYYALHNPKTDEDPETYEVNLMPSKDINPKVVIKKIRILDEKATKEKGEKVYVNVWRKILALYGPVYELTATTSEQDSELGLND